MSLPTRAHDRQSSRLVDARTLRRDHIMTRSRISLRRRRAVQWDMIGGLTLMGISLCMLGAMPWIWTAITAH